MVDCSTTSSKQWVLHFTPSHTELCIQSLVLLWRSFRFVSQSPIMPRWEFSLFIVMKQSGPLQSIWTQHVELLSNKKSCGLMLRSAKLFANPISVIRNFRCTNNQMPLLTKEQKPGITKPYKGTLRDPQTHAVQISVSPLLVNHFDGKLISVHPLSRMTSGKWQRLVRHFQYWIVQHLSCYNKLDLYHWMKQYYTYNF